MLNNKRLLKYHRGNLEPWNLPPPSRYPLVPTTESSATMELALRWVRDCEKHERCKRRSGGVEPPPLPTRVLDISSAMSDTIILREPVNQNRIYFCLSYCWGGCDFIKTLTTNIGEHKKGIKWEMLPFTFQNAIEVTRHLGARYIWIDALCIIQDDNKDWERESGKMANIYHNSWLTISATCAESPKAGCFSACSRVEINSVYAQLNRHFPNSPIDDESNVFPLLARAWTYQERMLAPRVLHFGPDEIAWECFDDRLCECSKRQSYMRDEVSKSDFFDGLIHETSSGLNSRAKRTWRQIVVQYSPLALTKPSDKLPALSGLAEHMRRSTNQIYLAGLCKDSLPLDLLWYRASTGRTLQQSSLSPKGLEGRAPSWSWASVDGKIMYDQLLYTRSDHEKSITVFCEVLHAECTAVGPSTTGQITAGQLNYHVL